MTWWFRAGCLVAAVGLVFWLTELRLARLRRERALLAGVQQPIHLADLLEEHAESACAVQVVVHRGHELVTERTHTFVDGGCRVGFDGRGRA